MQQVETGKAVLDQYAGYYDQGASEWRRLGAIDKCANIVALCEELPHRSVLEIGAGDGALLSRLSDLGFGEALHAVEISRSGVDVIRSRGIPRLVECALFDGYHLPYAAKQFDVAILSHVIEHVEHPRLLLYEATRVANYVFVEVPTEDISRRAQNYVADSVGHINFFSPRTIRWLVQSSGLGLRVLRQLTTNPSKETYAFEGRSGSWRYHLKRHLLRWAPAMAARYFCYHEALVATGLNESSDRTASGDAPTPR